MTEDVGCVARACRFHSLLILLQLWFSRTLAMMISNIFQRSSLKVKNGIKLRDQAMLRLIEQMSQEDTYPLEDEDDDETQPACSSVKGKEDCLEDGGNLPRCPGSATETQNKDLSSGSPAVSTERVEVTKAKAELSALSAFIAEVNEVSDDSAAEEVAAAEEVPVVRRTRRTQQQIAEDKKAEVARLQSAQEAYDQFMAFRAPEAPIAKNAGEQNALDKAMAKALALAAVEPVDGEAPPEADDKPVDGEDGALRQPGKRKQAEATADDQPKRLKAKRQAEASSPKAKAKAKAKPLVRKPHPDAQPQPKAKAKAKASGKARAKAKAN